jgi:NACHT domain
VNSPSIYWLNGLAGTGKTTIAFTVCQLLQEGNLPFTSFFCSRQLDSKDSRLLITTLCRDLAEKFRSFASELQPVLERDSKVVHAVLSSQIDKLLAKPWQASLNRRDGIRVPVVVIDAVDESDRGTEFLKELLGIVEHGALTGIKFLITSRTDPNIVDLCKSFPEDTVCRLHEVDTADVQQDIEKFLQEKLPNLKGSQELADLSRQSGGLFIYAATAVRFLRPPHTSLSASEEQSLLRELLETWPTSTDSGERLLVDELYEQILGAAFRDTRIYCQRLRILHFALCAEDRITVPMLSDLTTMDLSTVEKVVDSLHAVLYVSSKDNCVYWYHSSFPDFVFTPARAKFNLLPSNSAAREIDVFCNQAACHALLARRCFSIMELLHFNMCDLESSYTFDSDVPMLNDRVQRNIGPILQYASRHWARHLHRAAPAGGDTDDLFCALNDFLHDRLLFWIEAMNLIGANFECHSLLQYARDWLTKVRAQSLLIIACSKGRLRVIG